MKQTIGIFAHVDAGKTTFSECLLYLTNRIGKPGRVDHGSSLMDFDELEKRRGITIFSGVSSFSYSGREYYLIDTPGHIDFSAEMERAIATIDVAILVISVSQGVQSHTSTVYRLLKERNKPVYIFISKMDQAGTDASACLKEIQSSLCLNARLVKDAGELMRKDFIEWLCEFDDELMHQFLESEGGVEDSFLIKCIERQVSTGKIVLCMSGSALKQTGVLELMDVISKTFTTDNVPGEDFKARVFKVIHDNKGVKVAFIKCLSGTLALKAEVSYGEGLCEKVNEIRDYHGEKYTSLKVANAGDIVGVTGLLSAVPGTGLGGCCDDMAAVLRPTMKAAVLFDDKHYNTTMDFLRKMEAQDPMLEVSREPDMKEVYVHIVGKIQLEVLKELALERYNLDIAFGEFRIVYRETITSPIMGYGHFEPLRHYAEVHLRLEPNPGGGLAFKSELHTDKLGKQYQNLIRHHVLERDHKGVLTGSSLTDVCFVLTNGAVHLKHTDGGDLREATYRAVRQGLEKAESELLEPFYEFYIDVDIASVGRVLTDITRMHGRFDPPENNGERVFIKGSGPVATFLDYQADLLSFTKGSGSVAFRFSGYFPCHNTEAVIEKIGYQKERDMQNTSSSVFCAKGAGFEVKWDDAEKYMHLI